jgi:hypothetical protein
LALLQEEVSEQEKKYEYPRFTNKTRDSRPISSMLSLGSHKLISPMKPLQGWSLLHQPLLTSLLTFRNSGGLKVSVIVALKSGP